MGMNETELEWSGGPESRGFTSQTSASGAVLQPRGGSLMHFLNWPRDVFSERLDLFERSS